MKCAQIPLLILILMLAAGSVAAAESLDLPGPNWQREDALLAAEPAGYRETLSGLYGLVRTGRGDALLQEILAIDNEAELPGPARDRLLFELAAALGEFDPHGVGTQTLEYLRDRPPLARVPHEEYPGLGVPLYNVRAAAAGSLAARARLESPADAGVDADSFRDAESFLDTLSAATGPDVARHVRLAGMIFDPSELETIVLATPRMPDVTTASVVIAEVSPRMIMHPAVTDLMFDLLGHMELGSSAALALARSGDQNILRRLSDAAATGNGIAAQRASLAIGMFAAKDREP